MVEIKKTVYKSFGNALELSNGVVRLVITTDIGPRIINYSFRDGENVFWEDGGRTFCIKESEEVFGSPWYLYGGHRLCTSPEAFPRTYYPDNSPVEYELCQNGARFIQNVQKENGYRLEITVTLSPASSDAEIVHRLTNCSSESISAALWAISSMAPGGIEIIPRAEAKDIYTPDCHIALWPDSDISDSRVSFGKDLITLRQDESAKTNLKFGLRAHRGHAMYLNRGCCFLKQFDVNENGSYPDGGMSYETFTSRDFLEMETLGEYKTVAPHGTVSHTERWSLYKL